MKNSRTFPLLAACLLSMACSSSGSSERTLADLSASELCDLSEDLFSRAAKDSQKITCTSMAVRRSSEDQVDCEAFAQQCLQFTPNATPPDTCDLPESPACATKVTMDEVQGCIDAVAGEFSRFSQSVSCQTGLDDFDAFDPFENLPAECQALEQKCPGLLSS